MQATLFAKRDQLFRDALQLFGFRQRGHDLLVFDQGIGHIGKHRFAVFGCPIKFPSVFQVPHGFRPLK